MRRRVDGSQIARLRNEKKLDQTELAARLRARGLGANQATVSRWENGQEPRAYALPALAAELGVSIEDLYAAEDDAEAASPVAAAADTHDDMVAVLMPRATLDELVDARIAARENAQQR